MRFPKSTTKTLRPCRLQRALVAAVLLSGVIITCGAQTAPAPQDPLAQELNKYPGLLPEAGKLIDRLKSEVQFPADRAQSSLLTRVPASTQFYAAFPNYGDAVHQAMEIFRQELNQSAALRDWWHQGGMGSGGVTFEKSADNFYQLSQYLGNEIVLSGDTASGKENFIALAEVRKPGLKVFLQQLLQQSPASSPIPAVRVIDEQELAHLEGQSDTRPIILVRHDLVIAGSNIPNMRKFDSLLNQKTNGFIATPFGQRLSQSYQGGASIVMGANLREILTQIPGEPPPARDTLNRLGFDNVKFVVWNGKSVASQSVSQMELSFEGPRHGVAAWLAPPAALGSLDYVSPKAALVATVTLVNLAKIFDGTRELATATNPNVFATVDQMQQMMNVNLRNDLLSHLEGEITVEFDGLVQQQPVGKIILRVKDPDGLQQTLTKLLSATGKAPEAPVDEDGVKYYSIVVPSPQRPMRITYAFADDYMVIASTAESAKQAIQTHRHGDSFAKSEKFLASAPDAGSAQASGFLYYDPSLTSAMKMQTLSPDLAQLYSHFQSNPVYVRSYGDTDAIRVTSSSGGADSGAILVIAAIAIPTLLRAQIPANEAAAVGTMRTIVTAQVTYEVSYPKNGYARNLFALGEDPSGNNESSPEHARVMDWTRAACLSDAVCTKSGYRFTLVSQCRQTPCNEFTALATPLADNTGTRSFCSTSDGVIRFSPGRFTAPTLSDAECRRWMPLH